MSASRSLPALMVLSLAACFPTRAISPTPLAGGVRGLPALRAALDSIVDAPVFRNANWGVLVVAAGGDTLYSHNAGKLFMPASNMKLLTTSVALTQLGPDFRSRTTLVTTA